MVKLEYTFKNDTLFKTLFVKHPGLLKRLVSELLGLRLESIGEFIITNPDMPPEFLGDKFCRLDINMIVDGQRVDLEIQVADEGDFPERSLYYWARDFSLTLPEGGKYKNLPRTIIISILGFSLFDCDEYHSEYQPLEIMRHTRLTDKQSLHYFELPKLPEAVSADDELKLWLALFKAETEEELEKIEAMGVEVMEQAISAYRQITATDEFKEMERQRHYAMLNRSSAIGYAVDKEREKWQGVVAEKDAEWQGVVAEKDAKLADKDEEIARLRAQLEQRK